MKAYKVDQFLNGEVKLTTSNGEIEVCCDSNMDENLNVTYSVWTCDHKLNGSTLEYVDGLKKSEVLDTMIRLGKNAENYDMFMRLLLIQNYDWNFQ